MCNRASGLECEAGSTLDLLNFGTPRSSLVWKHPFVIATLRPNHSFVNKSLFNNSVTNVGELETFHKWVNSARDSPQQKITLIILSIYMQLSISNTFCE